MRQVDNGYVVATVDGINTVSQLNDQVLSVDEDESSGRYIDNVENNYINNLDQQNNSLENSNSTYTCPQLPMPNNTVFTYPNTHVMPNIPEIPTLPPPIVPGERLYSHAHNRESILPVESRGVIAGSVQRINPGSASGISTQNNKVNDIHQNSTRMQENSINSTSDNNTNKWLRHLPSETVTYSNLPVHNAQSSIFTCPTLIPRTDLKLLVASSSITKSINIQRFNECFGSGTARIQKWPGGRARHIKNYIGTHLEEENPDILIVQAGGNDLAERDRAPIWDIAKDVVEIGIKARNLGIQEIFIGGVPTRRDQFRHEDLHELNHAISTLCRQHGFVFIDNREIGMGHLYDGVHLNTAGTTILASNYLEALRVKYRGYYTG